MADLKHLLPSETGSTEQYKYGGPNPPIEFKTPARDRQPHAKKLVGEIESAVAQSVEDTESLPEEAKPKGIVLDFVSDPGFKLRLQSLEMRRSGIELRNSRTDNEIMHGTVFVPQSKAGLFIKRFEQYANEDTGSGKPKRKDLVASIAAIRLATLSSFWTDAGQLPETDDVRWWEIWLREATNPHDVDEVFRQRAEVANVHVGSYTLRFPERLVVLARGTVSQLLSIENLFDILAEIRLAKVLSGEYLQLSPSEQSEFIEEALERIQPPQTTVSSVCHLDSGVNIGHPLLALASNSDHVLTVNPNWTSADGTGHGTSMAGLALYGCLTDLLNSTEPFNVGHHIESVKIFHPLDPNEPELYGEITNQACSRIEIAAPERLQRAFCLTITSDSRDAGYPSSWSAAVDQICAGVEGDELVPHRLMIVSAGNLELNVRREYPFRNRITGVEDPAQAYNALTVGAYTEKVEIRDTEYADWKIVAERGALSPASCTSQVWDDKSWPLKPDIVMEGGNNAIDPSTNEADFVGDLLLLTTRVDASGSVLTSTGDTSGATALASHYAAKIGASYPSLWPESVRGLLVHSARWTQKMISEYPGNTKQDLEARLRCYGYGTPDLQRALLSARNSASLIIQDSLQPFHQLETTDGNGTTTRRIATRDMKLHRLPWPVEVLQGLGETEVRMRVTLSFYIEPSPGRRGWTRKHRYQSHGLVFEVKRPYETDDDLLKRISAATRSADDDTSFGTDQRTWELGDRLRRKGSIHSDTWTGTAADLAVGNSVAVYPITGWWKERSYLERWNRQAQYSLIITLETDSEDVDLYTPIANQIGIDIEL